MGISLKKLDAAKIEEKLYSFVRPMFDTDDVFVMGGSRSRTVNFERQVYCNSPVEIKNREAYAQTVSRIEIFVQNTSSGIKNASVLTRIRDKITSSLQGGVKLGDYHFDYIDEINGDDRAGFNYIFINLATKIL